MSNRFVRYLVDVEDNGPDYSQSTTISYDIVATIIFVFMSFVFFFPYNSLIPLDRRTCAAIAATLCYVTRAFLFPNNKMDLEGAVDFDVIVLLAAIMAINYIVVHQKETKDVIVYVQTRIYDNPRNGFWLVSFAAFIVSPFLTNDGVCLLFVEPILNAFDRINTRTKDEPEPEIGNIRLEKTDAFYFLLALACSTNSGSALTYTGNPQNMIVGNEAVEVMPSIVFLGYMLLPSVFAFVITTMWIERCWMRSRELYEQGGNLNPLTAFKKPAGGHFSIVNNPLNDSTHSAGSTEMIKFSKPNSTSNHGNQGNSNHNDIERSNSGHNFQAMETESKSSEPKKPLTLLKKGLKFLVSPFPYAMLFLMGAMIVMIFVDAMSIAGLVCVTSVVMIIVLVLGNHWQGLPIFGGDPDARPLTAEEKVANTALFFDELFESIDYSLLIIFLGMFIVVENVASTGIPKQIWDKLVGGNPFRTFASVTGISAFVLIASQFLGNVAVVQLARPNVEPLPDAEKRYAWAIISFVATIGGNLTITGSAANIIVAEKAARIDPNSGIDFFRHYAVCFWVTLLCTIVGALMITGIVMIDNNMRESW